MDRAYSFPEAILRPFNAHGTRTVQDEHSYRTRNSYSLHPTYMGQAAGAGRQQWRPTSVHPPFAPADVESRANPPGQSPERAQSADIEERESPGGSCIPIRERRAARMRGIGVSRRIGIPSYNQEAR